jgi:hypothetical protein
MQKSYKSYLRRYKYEVKFINSKDLGTKFKTLSW